MDFKRKVREHQEQKFTKQQQLNNNMKAKNNTKTLDQFVEEQYGKRGTKKREKFEKGYENFKIGVLIQQARLEKGLTQDQLAMRCGTNKGYISKIENDIKEVRLSTLQRIVEIGLGGHLDLSIRF
jgi:HTH-type transcriptional regulator / antitoxin HipB